MKGLTIALSLLLASIIAFGALAHAMLPHEHSANEAVASLLHSALRHEDKTLGDVVPPAPLFAAIVIAAAAALPAFTLLLYMLRARAPALSPLRDGTLAYRRFG